METNNKQTYFKPEITALSSSITHGQTSMMGDAKSGDTMEDGNSTMGIS